MKQEIQEQLAISAQIKDTISTEGWKHIEQLLKDYIRGLDSLRGVETMKELLGRRHAVRLLESWLNSVKTLAEFKNLHNSQKTKTIYKVVNPVQQNE